MQLQDGRITMLISYDGTTIEIHDNQANTTFCTVKLTPEQLSHAMSKLGNTKCEVTVHNLSRVGTMHENAQFEFEIPPNLSGSDHTDALTVLCNEKLRDSGMEDWTPDIYYGRQDSFFELAGTSMARVTIRRWVKQKTKKR